MSTKKPTCIIGIGNTIRGDDGVGKYVAEQIEKNNLPGITVITTHQLDMGLAEDISKFDTVLFIDASFSENTFSLLPLLPDNHPSQSFSHQVNASVIVSLSQQLFSTHTKFYICAIGVNNFEIGNGISETTKANADAAIAAITNWLEENA